MLLYDCNYIISHNSITTSPTCQAKEASPVLVTEIGSAAGEPPMESSDENMWDAWIFIKANTAKLRRTSRRCSSCCTAYLAALMVLY